MSNPYAASNASMDEPVQQTYEPEIFALNGRLGRIRYLAYSFLINFITFAAVGILIAVLAAVMGANNPMVSGGLILLAYVPILATAFIMAKRRLNDLDLSGWWSLLFVIPPLNLYLLFAPGTRGPNRYGAGPCANNTGLVVVACVFLLGIPVLGILAAVALPAYSAYTQKAKFSEVVLATNAAKIGVEICAQEHAQPGTGEITGCGGGSNGVPQDLASPSGNIASVTTADNGVITATASSINGLHGQTYILTPRYDSGNGKVTWAKGGTCTTNSPAIC